MTNEISEKNAEFFNHNSKITRFVSDGCASLTIEVPSENSDYKIHSTLSISTENKFHDLLSGNASNEITDLLIKAVNNRTKERNYFKLYCDLLDGTITDDEFDNLISKNEDDYIVEESENPTLNKTTLALKLAKRIKDVKTINDLSSLFSFNPYELEKYAALDL